MPERIEIVEGDITTLDVDAIVNAANSSLLGGGGVDGAIHAAAGPSLLEECRELRRTSLTDGLPVGAAVATGAGRLAARWVIHTVGPDRHAGQTDPALLASCFESSLAEAARVGERPAGHVLVEHQARVAAVAQHERGPDVRARGAAVDDVEERFEARVVQRVGHPAGVGAAHAPAADDRGDPVIQLSPPLIAERGHVDELFGVLGGVLRAVA